MFVFPKTFYLGHRFTCRKIKIFWSPDCHADVRVYHLESWMPGRRTNRPRFQLYRPCNTVDKRRWAARLLEAFSLKHAVPETTLADQLQPSWNVDCAKFAGSKCVGGLTI